MEKYHPRKYQPIITEAILENKRVNIWAEMGLGKTVATLTAIELLVFLGEITEENPALVLAPLRVAKGTWPEEITKWEHLQGLKVQAIIGTKTEREEALKKKAHIFTMNYENLQWLDSFHSKKEWPFKMIVADESTRLKGLRSRQGKKRAMALAKYAHKKADRFVNLTGTPAPNGLQDLWGQNWFIDGGERLGRTFTAYTNRWFQRAPNGFGNEPLYFAQEQIEDKLKDVCVSLRAKDYFDLKEPIKTVVKVNLPPKARKLYNNMENEMYMELEAEGVEAFNAAIRTNKCLQISNGAAYFGENSKEWEEIHSEKIKALESIIEEAAGMPVLVAYNFKSDLIRLQKAFPQGKILDNKRSTKKAWDEGKIPILFTHPASAGHGLNLQKGSNIIVFFGVNWNLEEHVQIIERIGPVRQMQAGFDRPVFIYYILAEKTVDFLVKQRLDTKKDVQEILVEAMKQRKKS